MLTYAAKTDLGNQRENNEDAFLAQAKHGLWILADGVGGLDAGEIASEIGCQSISNEIISGASAEDAIQTAHHAILAAPKQGRGQPGMASTVVVLLVHGDSYQVSWVGDSRAYLWRPANNGRKAQLIQISRDQSLVQKLLDEGVITEEQAVDHPRKNLVLQALGQPDLSRLEVETERGQFHEGDQLLMCSDGLSDYVCDEDISELLSVNTDADDKVDALINRALLNQGKDNITAILVDLSNQDLVSTQEVPAISATIAEPQRQTQKKSHRLWLAAIIPVIVIGSLLTLWLLSQV